MAKPRRIHVPGENRLLAALPRREYDRLLPELDTFPLSFKHILFDVDQPITHIYFPLTGVVSLVILLGEGQPVEVCMVGNEGLAGTPVFLGADRSPTRATCQIPGEALRMKAKVFEEEVGRGGPLHGLVQRYTQAMINQISQSVACNQRHSVEERMCRWLLMTHNRVGSDEFPLTQEFLAQMLGVRRPTVTVVAGMLQKAGLIQYQRGRMTVLDREGLEAASCGCYAVVKRGYDRLLG
jgi:CRP-like cAMP-binding protein